MCWGRSLCERLVQYSPHTPSGCQTSPGRTGTIDHILNSRPLPCSSSFLIWTELQLLPPHPACACQFRHIGTERARPPKEKPSFYFPLCAQLELSDVGFMQTRGRRRRRTRTPVSSSYRPRKGLEPWPSKGLGKR